MYFEEKKPKVVQKYFYLMVSYSDLVFKKILNNKFISEKMLNIGKQKKKSSKLWKKMLEKCVKK